MKRFYIFLTLAISLLLFYGAIYGAEDKKALEVHPTPQDEMQRIQQQQNQQQRPILPPVVSQPASMISPTPSPHITAPQITPQVISQPQIMPQARVPQPPTMQNIPSIPTYAAAPTVPVPVEAPNIPVMGSAVGKVIDTGLDKDGALWIEVNDELFGENMKIKMDMVKKTPVTKQGSIMSFKDIKIGDMVNVIFTNKDKGGGFFGSESDENIASFVNILTEEDMKMMNQASPDLTVTPQENNPQPNKE